MMTVVAMSSGHYHDADSPQPGPSILVHKQALNDDGSFNFVFAADNGMRQGERILPDGTRVGAYSYVDPNGETISVKYKAGKDGFKILEGAHIPTPPAPRVSDDPLLDSPSDMLLPTPVVRTTERAERAERAERPHRIRERIKKETPPPKRLMKIPVVPKRMRIRTKGPVVMVQRMPNESDQRVASFHVEQPTYRGQLNKAPSEWQSESRPRPQPTRGRESNPDIFGNNESPKAYSFQFGSAR